jgi:hypothetical protein
MKGRRRIWIGEIMPKEEQRWPTELLSFFLRTGGGGAGWGKGASSRPTQRAVRRSRTAAAWWKLAAQTETPEHDAQGLVTTAQTGLYRVVVRGLRFWRRVYLQVDADVSEAFHVPSTLINSNKQIWREDQLMNNVLFQVNVHFSEI